jgi:Ca2+-binding EF-hand superfamily protein
MKILVMKAVAVTALLMFSFTVAAQQNPARYFKKLDANEDGMLNLVEFKTHSDFWMDKRGWDDEEKRERVHQSTFDKRDLDEDGQITLNEFIDTSK